MRTYADTSFLAAVYSPEAGSIKALSLMQRLREPLPFTPFHRHELRNGIRLRVFRKEISAEQRKAAFQEIDSDLEENVLAARGLGWHAVRVDPLGDTPAQMRSVLRDFGLLA